MDKKFIVIVICLFIFSFFTVEILMNSRAIEGTGIDPLWIGENETVTYTSSEETHCINNTCTLTMYSGVMFTKEPDGWHTLTEVSNVTWQNGGFNFSYRNYWVLIEPFVIYNGNYKTIQDIKNAFPNVDIKDYISVSRFSHKFAVNFSNVPQDLLDNTDYIGLRLKDSHGLTWNDVRKTSDQSIVIKNKVEINYGDLIDSGFTLNFVNKTYLLIGNISNNTVDGMIYIDPTIYLGEGNEVLVPESANITLGKSEYSVLTANQTIIVPTEPSAVQNVTRRTIAETTHPTTLGVGTILTSAQYAMVNATGGTQYTVAGSSSADVYFMWNITLPLTTSLNWVNVLATMNTSGTTDLKHLALWNFSSGAYVNVYSSACGTTWTNATFNITGANLTWFVGNNNRTIYFLPHGSGTATGNVGIDYMEARAGYNNLTSSDAGNWTNVIVSDDSYWIIKSNANNRTGVNFSYTTGLTNPVAMTIQVEIRQTGTFNLRLYIYNFTGSTWYDTSKEDLNPTVDTWYNYTILAGLSDFINYTTGKIYIKMESASNGVGSGYLFIDDPVITLNETNGGNVGDATVAQSGVNTNYGAYNILQFYNSTLTQRTFLLWNMSVIPAGSTITNANLSLYIYIAPSSTIYAEAYNTSPMNTTGTTYWNEGTLLYYSCGSGINCNLDHNITWNNQPSALTLQDNITNATVNNWMYWNVTNAAKSSFANTTYQRMSILLKASLGSASTVTYFYSKEEATQTTKRPQLVITYTAGDSPPTFSNYNANTTVAGVKVNFSTVISDDVSLSGYIFETNNTGSWINYTWASLISGGTAYNVTTLNAVAGTRINVSFYANDSLNQWSVYKDGLTTTSASTCTNFNTTGNLNCNDNCTNTTVIVAGDLRIYSTGPGTANLTNIKIVGDLYENYTHNCYVYWYGYRNITGG